MCAKKRNVSETQMSFNFDAPKPLSEIDPTVSEHATPASTSSEITTSASTSSEIFKTSQSLDEQILSAYLHWNVDQLASEIRHHNRLYRDGHPKIKDATFDLLTRQLEALSPEHEALNEFYEASQSEDEDKPATLSELSTNRSGKKKVYHAVAMLSLGKAYSAREVVEKAKGFVSDFVASPKLDGLACSLKYDANGNLELASTRGDGQRGDDITSNVRYIQAIPKHIQASNVEIRGEVYMPLSSFERFDDAVSPRNLAVGGLKQKDPAETAKYGLSFFGYELLGETHQTEMEKLARIQALGFQAVAHRLIVRPANDAKINIMSLSPDERDAFEAMRGMTEEERIECYIQRMLEQRDSWDFEADGLVFKANAVSEQNPENVTLHHPKYAVAFKFQGDEGITTLRSVEWQVAKTGVITPVAHFDTVVLSGAAIQRATLIHAAHVEHFPMLVSNGDHETSEAEQTALTQTHLKLGSRILVSRRGGVIPCIEYVVSEPVDSVYVTLPQTCPSCGAPAVIRASSLHDEDKKQVYYLYCTDPDNCPSTGQALIENYTKIIECLGFGEKIIEALYDANLVSTPADLYRLSVADIAYAIASSKVDRATTEVDTDAVLPQKLYDSIQASRNMPLHRFLEALSIPNLGKKMSLDLEKWFGTLEQIRAASDDDFVRCLYIKDQGRLLHQAVHSSVRAYDETVAQWLTRLKVNNKTSKAIRDFYQGREDRILAASAEELEKVLIEARKKEDPKKLYALRYGFESRKKLIDDLLGYVTLIESTQNQAQTEDGPFKGMSFLFTGTLVAMKREDAQKRVEALGGSAASGVSKTLSVLVATSHTSSKWKKAEELNQKGASIQLWTEEVFLEKLKEAETSS